MKRFLIVMMAVGIFGGTPVHASHHLDGELPKDHVTECVIQADSIQKKIMRIQNEVKKGSKQYSAEELKKLNEKLREANETLDTISKQ